MNRRVNHPSEPGRTANGEILSALRPHAPVLANRRFSSPEASPARKGQWLAGLIFGAVTFAAAAVGAPVSKRKPWYRSLRKSAATPPDWVFGPVWTVLDASIAYSGWRTWRTPDSAARTRALRLWGLQMGLNAAWSPLFFGAHRPKASFAVTAALVPTIAGYIKSAREVDRTAGNLMVPYLGWTGFATFLNLQILRKNAWRFQ
jgi:translocator protein